MPSVSRSRLIAAEPDRVWRLVGDPHGLARWWPRASRVEDVIGEGGRARWTLVLATEKGKPVRLDYRATGSTEGRRYAWEQQLADTPFERILRSAELELELEPQAGQEATKVTLRSDERLRGLSRLGSPLMRRATGDRLDEALDGLDRALVGEPGE